VITAARVRLVPRLRDTETTLAGVGDVEEVHALARRAVREVPGLVSAEFFTRTGLDILVAHAGLAAPLAGPTSGRSRRDGFRWREVRGNGRCSAGSVRRSIRRGR
jgi:NAD(P)-dependent dehydrogenase (short-subunit alcohol dehydrogenase family)